jgi:hypothetical protein
MFKNKIWLQFLLVSLLLMLSLSCNMPFPQAVEPTPNTSPQEDPYALLTQVSATVASAEKGGDIVIELTEGQLTAAANEALRNQGPEDIKNLQIDLNDGLMTATGQMNQNGIDFPVKVVLSIAVDGSGSPYVNVQEGKVGPIPLPQNVLDQLKVQFDQILKSQISAVAGNAIVKSISVNDSTMVIVAEKQ